MSFYLIAKFRQSGDPPFYLFKIFSLNIYHECYNALEEDFLVLKLSN